ncbi:MAG: ATP-binding cassette domain-containing protein [Planctomycetota bacterium]
MSPSLEVELRGVSKAYPGASEGGVRALHQVSLKLSKGRTLALIGPSGCGKSTLLRCLMGGVLPDSGEVLLDGQPMTRETRRELTSRIGYVIQSGGLFSHLTAADNVTLAARYRGFASAEIRSRLEELRTLVHLPEATMERYPSELSGGQRQRIGLMRALFLDPDLLLLDEPLGALDPMIRAELQKELGEIFRTLDKTVCLVTHDLFEAATLGQELCLMKEGQIVQHGEARELFHEPASDFVQRFVSAQSAPLDALDGLRGGA